MSPNNLSLAAETEREASPTRLAWSRFLPTFRESWRPGQHVSIFGPTGKGKTVLAIRGLLPLRAHVLTLDAKGGDPELRRAGRRIRGYPGWWQIGNDGSRYRVHVPPDEARSTFGEVLAKVYKDGEWTVYLDEARLLTDYLNLSAAVHKLWLFARSRGVSVVAGTQAPRYVPSAMYDQASHLFIGRVRDRRVVDRLSELVADVPEARGIIPRLHDHDFLWVGPDKSAIVRYPMASSRRGGS